MDVDDHRWPALIFASANASARYALTCVEPVPAPAGADPATRAPSRLRAKSTFVDPQGRAMHWHDFGDLEGPGWAANAIGGSVLLYRWGRYTGSRELCMQALALADHVLEDGFIRSDGFVYPYWDLAAGRFCLNYTHNDAWLCPGSLAKVGTQMLDLATAVEDDPAAGQRGAALRQAAAELYAWLVAHTPVLPNGWVPRRITPAGDQYPLTPEGGADPIFDHSADGLFLLDLGVRLGDRQRALTLGEAFVTAGGFWGSINHDTYDDHENVAYAVAFRVLRRAAGILERPAWHRFAYEVALPAMAAFRMADDLHGVVTRGLFWMEKSWDTAYLWENAEVAQAHLEAWLERDDRAARDVALATLGAIAHHHYGPLGFLTEGVDWNNHVSQRHHIDQAYYGAIRYTEPLLNNLHLVEATLTYLEAEGVSPPVDTELGASLDILATLPQVPHAVQVLRDTGGRYLLRLYHPAIATDAGVEAVLAFARAAGIDGVLLFEASYDTDAALLPLAVLEGRFARLKAIVPRFREAGLGVHINVMITMGHVDGGGAQPEAFDFQYLVDSAGHVSRSTACPLDPTFLDYVEQIYRWAAACSADAVWVDDDVRFLWHDVREMACFCPLHLAAMEARTGRRWTREALVAALGDDTADPSVRGAWFDIAEGAMLGLAGRVEAAVHGEGGPSSGMPESRDRHVRAGLAVATQDIGLMSVGTTAHNAEGRRTDRLLRVLSGAGGHPMVRPGSGFWHDWEPAAVLAKTEDVARQIAYLGADVRTVAEIENHPYSPFGKSLRVLSLEMALNALAGVQDLSLNLFSSTMPFGEGETPASLDRYAAFLREQRPFLQALVQARAGKRRVGVGVEAREDVARQMRLAGRSLLAWVEPRPWELALARLGLPVGQPYDSPHLLTRDVVFTDRYALGSGFQDGVVLTPGALEGLLAQGWGDRLGVAGVHAAPPDANEVLTADEFNGTGAGTCLQVRHYSGLLHPHMCDFAPGTAVRALSRWVDLQQRIQGPATAAWELVDGARVGFIPFEIETMTPALLHPARREQWAAMLAWVARAPLPVRVVEGVNVAPQYFLAPDGVEILVALANLSADEQRVRIAGPLLDRHCAVERLALSGQWEAVADATDADVAPWSVAVLRLR